MLYMTICEVHVSAYEVVLVCYRYQHTISPWTPERSFKFLVTNSNHSLFGSYRCLSEKTSCIVFFLLLFLGFFLVTPEGFTTVVANEGLEKARAYLNQVPGTDGFTSPPKDAV